MKQDRSKNKQDAFCETKLEDWQINNHCVRSILYKHDKSKDNAKVNKRLKDERDIGKLKSMKVQQK